MMKLSLSLSLFSIISWALINPSVEVLPNGMKVVINENHTNEVAAIRLYVKAGSILEDEYGGAGISHYLEHIIAGGSTTKRTEQEYKLWAQKIGARINAYTSEDHTCYHITVNSKYWKDALQMIAEWIQYCKFDSQEVIREKGVIEKEILYTEKRPYSKMWRIFEETMFEAHPIRYPVIGYESVFKELTREDLLNYYDQYYQPQNMILVVSGNVKTEEVLEEVKKQFKGFSRKRYASISIPQEPHKFGIKKREIFLNIQHPRIFIGFPTVPFNHPDMFPLHILAEILNRATFEFNKRLKEEKEIINYLYTLSSNTNFEAGYFLIEAEVKNSRYLKEVEEEIFKLLNELPQLITEQDIEIAVKNMKAKQLLDWQSIRAEASVIGISMVRAGIPDYFTNVYIKAIEQVSKKQITGVVEKYFKLDRATVIYFFPETEKTIEKVKAERAKVGDIEKIEFPNGLKILYKKNTTFPTFSLIIAFKGGKQKENRNNNGITNLAINMLTRGAGGLSKREIEKIFESLGATYKTDITYDYATIEIEGLKEDFDELTKLLSKLILSPSFPEDEFEKLKKDVIADIKRRKENPEQVSFLFFEKNFFKEHPYGIPDYGTIESVERLTLKEVRNFYFQKLSNPKEIIVGVFGDLDKAKVTKKLKNIFGNLKPSLTEEIQDTFSFLRDTTLIDLYPFEQVNIRIAFPTISIESRDYFPLRIIEQLFSSSKGRLYHALRGKRDLAYFGYGYQFITNLKSCFKFHVQTSLEKYEETMKVVLEEVEKLKEEEIEKEELERTKNEILLDLPMRLETNRQQLHFSIKYELYGLGYDFLEKFKEEIKKVSSEDVNQVAKKYFKHPFITLSMPKQN